MKKILLIDNYDSFTFNLVQQIQSIKQFNISVKRNDEKIIPSRDKFDILIISPGPKTPKEAGISNDLIKKFYKKVPILGVCLGMQCINEVFGGETVQGSPVHGKVSPITHNQKQIFKGVPKNINVARYHSLKIDSIPNEIEVTAWAKDKTPMAIKHKEYPTYGVQFHPESFLTPHGEQIMRNFLALTK